MSTSDSFFEPEEKRAIESFLKEGYLIFPIENRPVLDGIRKSMFQFGSEQLSQKKVPDLNSFFDNIHDYLTPKELNDFRVKLIAFLTKDAALKPKIYSMAKQCLHWIVGNELAMQRSWGLSMQLPGDKSSLLPLHSDVWSGNSAFEVVFWLPLVDCFKTKSMFVLPREKSDAVYKDFKHYSKMTAEELFRSVEKDVVWLDIPYGHGLLFSHALLHGNRVNDEKTTRWTMNIRFKGLLSPYAQKELGESFLPITLRPITRIGAQYRMPEMK